MERLVKTQQPGKDLAGAVVIYEFWRFAITLLLHVVTICKWSVNPIANAETQSIVTLTRDNT
jgi:hypothetical protein